MERRPCPEVARVLAAAPFAPEAWYASPACGEHDWMVVVARGWPHLDCAVHGAEGDRWLPRPLDVAVQESRPVRGIPPRRDLARWNGSLHALFEGIPLEVRRAVAPLAAADQWWTMRLVAAVPEVLPVVQDLPSLGRLLALHHAPLVGHDEAAALRAALRRPRRRLLPLLGLPPEQWLIRVLRKLDPRCLPWDGTTPLVELLGTEDRRITKLLRHLPTIGPDVAAVLHDPGARRLASFALLNTPPGPEPMDLRLLDALSDLARARDEGRAPRQPAVFRSWHEVVEAWERIEPVDRQLAFAGPFPTPTEETDLPGAPSVHLRLLRSAAEMKDHGVRQENCLRNESLYPEEAREGLGAMYEVTWPGDGEEVRAATLWLERVDDGWILDELRGPNNSWVPAWLVRRIGAWVTGVCGEPPPAERPALLDRTCVDPAIGSAGYLPAALSRGGLAFAE